MERIAIVGCGGSGKARLAGHLGARSDLRGRRVVHRWVRRELPARVATAGTTSPPDGVRS